MPPAHSIIRFIFSTSRSPSGVSAPMTTPLAPRSEYEIWQTDEQEFRECAQIVHAFA